jgi:hypothetical protein
VGVDLAVEAGSAVVLVDRNFILRAAAPPVTAAAFAALAISVFAFALSISPFSALSLAIATLARGPSSGGGWLAA